MTAEHTCGYYPPASKKALLRSLRAFGRRDLRETRMKPCRKPATHVDHIVDEATGNKRTLYLCTPHAKHNARRGFHAQRIVNEESA